MTLLFFCRSILPVVFLIICAAGILAQQRPDRTTPPLPGPPPQLRLPPIQKETLSNGLAVWIVVAHEVPLVQVNLLVKAGGGDEPSGLFGLASMTAAMLDEGAGNRSALEIADSMEFFGASLITSSSFDASAVRLNVPVARLQDALPILADVALRPAFPEKELNRLRDERITALLQARDDPSAVVNLAFARVVFGLDHRYGTALNGTEAALKAMSVQNLRAFHSAMYRPTNAVLLVVGDVTVGNVVPQLQKHFGAWRAAGPVTRPAVPQAQPLAESQITIIDMPSAAQSQIRIGGAGVARSTADYFPLQVLNAILGGSFTSRLNQNLREEHGYSYGVSSRFEMRRSVGPFIAGGGVQTDKTAESIREFFKELNGIAKPVGADELTKAKNYIALGYPGDFETIGDLSARLEEMAVYNLPEDYFNRYIANIQAVSSDAVLKAASTTIQPRRFAVVVAGDRKVIEPGIRALNLAPVRVMTLDDVLR
jgi:predicted Zn-dependent peptidase